MISRERRRGGPARVGWTGKPSRTTGSSAKSPRRTRSSRGSQQGAPPPAEPVDSPQLKVAVAVRPALFGELLASRLDEEEGVMVVGRVVDEDEIGKLLSIAHPLVLIFDYEGLGPNAEGTVNRLRRAIPGTRILVLASRSNDETIQRVLRAGAAGILGKHVLYATLLRAIHAVAAGEVWADRHATSEALAGLTNSFPRTSKTGLTRREQQIAEACGQGLRNREIASRLDISAKTVKSHLNNIFRKLQLENRIELALRMAEQGLPKA